MNTTYGNRSANSYSIPNKQPKLHINYTTATTTKYYSFNGQKVALRKNGVLYYLHTDHLGGTALVTKADGTVESEQGYYAYGRYRTGGTLPTDHKFTGQKLDSSGLYYYNARYYDPEMGIFVSPDSMVPDLGTLIDYNRYAYARANPLNNNDPTGHAPQSPNDDPNNPAPCATDWCWQNRWFVAHGLHWGGDTWNRSADARFYDPNILSDVLGEMGLAPASGWSFSQLSLVGQGAVALARKVGGVAALHQLLGGNTITLYRENIPGGASSDWSMWPPFAYYMTFYDGAFSFGDDYARATTVHELAHIIDFEVQGWNPWGGLTPQFPQGKKITNYAPGDPYEYFAEAVADWVYGMRYLPNEEGRSSINSEQRQFLNVNLVSTDPHLP